MTREQEADYSRRGDQEESPDYGMQRKEAVTETCGQVPAQLESMYDAGCLFAF